MVERQLFKIILIGNLLLTATLITGFVFVQDMFAQGKAHKAFFLSSLGWCTQYYFGVTIKKAGVVEKSHGSLLQEQHC